MHYFKNNSRETKSFKLLGKVYTMAPGEVIQSTPQMVEYFLYRTYGVWMARATAEEYAAHPCREGAAQPKSRVTPKPRPIGAETFEGPTVTVEDDDEHVSPAVVMAHYGIMGPRG